MMAGGPQPLTWLTKRVAAEFRPAVTSGEDFGMSFLMYYSFRIFCCCCCIYFIFLSFRLIKEMEATKDPIQPFYLGSVMDSLRKLQMNGSLLT